MENFDQKSSFISWPVLAMMCFVTVIGFDDLIYNLQGQGLGVVTSWILMLFLYVVPYALMVGQLGSVFSNEGGGLSSWVRGTNGEFLGYFTAWTYWAASIPYVVDTANSVVVGLGWAIQGNASMQDNMSNSMFALLTFVVFGIFIFVQSRFKHSLEILGTIGGVAMFGMTVLFVLMTAASLMRGGHIATQPFTYKTLIPKFDLHYLTTIGLLIYAVNGSELIAPFVSRMKKPQSDFPKAMIMLAVMTAFLTIFGSLALGVFFNAYNLPHDLKMNGSYYAFQALGKSFNMGNTLMYIFAWTEVFYLAALLAVLLEAMTRMLISDTGARYMPKVLRKKNASGLPINGYLLTVGLSAFIMLLGIFLPDMNDIFNWLLNLNGIISPGVTCWVFFAFIKIRMNSDKYPSDYVFIKNDKLALAFGWWCFIITAVATVFGFGPQDVKFASSTWWYELIINIIAIVVLIGLGAVMPYITSREERSTTGAAFTRVQWTGILSTIIIGLVLILYLGGTHIANKILYILIVAIASIVLVMLFGRREYNLAE